MGRRPRSWPRQEPGQWLQWRPVAPRRTRRPWRQRQSWQWPRRPRRPRSRCEERKPRENTQRRRRQGHGTRGGRPFRDCMLPVSAFRAVPEGRELQVQARPPGQHCCGTCRWRFLASALRGREGSCGRYPRHREFARGHLHGVPGQVPQEVEAAARPRRPIHAQGGPGSAAQGVVLQHDPAGRLDLLWALGWKHSGIQRGPYGHHFDRAYWASVCHAHPRERFDLGQCGPGGQALAIRRAVEELPLHAHH
mmetsp:Transcript_95641/g.270666  ORF Transcript_95641/g.270666 Transcript_95641/m.270666 type:complete len:250 (+) Transcript_95641:165-914(+)